MYAKYIKKEIADLNGTGRTQAVYQMKTTLMNYDWFVDLCHREGAMSKDAIKGVMALIEEKLALCLAERFTVKLGDIGTFTAKLGVSFEPGEASHNARNIRVTGASFRASNDFVEQINRKCTLVKDGESRIRQPQTTLQERIELARKFLEKRPLMRIRDYVRLTGLSRTTASLELRRIEEDPSSGITSTGSHSQKYYILKL